MNNYYTAIGHGFVGATKDSPDGEQAWRNGVAMFLAHSPNQNIKNFVSKLEEIIVLGSEEWFNGCTEYFRALEQNSPWAWAWHSGLRSAGIDPAKYPMPSLPAKQKRVGLKGAQSEVIDLIKKAGKKVEKNK